mmetsp:Transcript_95470/g.205982  ORF Transcript_95470/g.205982 Transcript_95470/m.205982 type:complete len:108 (-) Transcript_95470:156-479(-)
MSEDILVSDRTLQSALKCVICLEDLTNDKITLECSHAFHYKCLKNWFVKNKINCPYCRKDFSAEIQQRILKRNEEREFLRNQAERLNQPNPFFEDGNGANMYGFGHN